MSDTLHPDSPLCLAVLACDVFRHEIDWLQSRGAKWSHLEFFEMGLHDQPDLMRQSLQEALSQLEDSKPAINSVVLLYGSCGRGLVGVTSKRCNLIIAQAHDCISILLGGCQVHEQLLQQEPGAYFYSPGWVRGKRVPGPDRSSELRKDYRALYGDDEELLDELIEADRYSFSHQDCVLYLSPVPHEEAEQYSRCCAGHLGWRFRKEQGDISLIRNLLTGAWQDPRILNLNPGDQLELNASGRLIVAPKSCQNG